MHAFGGYKIVGRLHAVGIGALVFLCACGPPETPGLVTQLDAPALEGSGQAHLAGGGDTPVILSWQEPTAEGGTALRVSRVDGSQWAQPQTVAQGQNWFVNWADFPSVVPLESSLLIAHWLPLKPDERYAYDIAYSLSDDGGRSWSNTRVLNADAAIAEHGFVSFFEWGTDIGAVWLDGRAIAALTIDELFALEEPVGMTLRFARMDRSGTVVERGEIDELVCDCCQTDAVTTDAGPLIVYRDRTTEEIRDITVRRAEPVVGSAGSVSTTGWTEPVTLGPDGWLIDGCPVNGPALSAAGEHVGVAWFTAADNQPRLRFARSRNAGRDFDAAITVAAQNVLGQADIVMTADGTAWVSAWHRAEQGMELNVHRIAHEAPGIDTRIVATTTASLPSDVPQMVLSDGQLILAWSELGNPGRLYSAKLSLW
jgi:hypothetical protein